ncbi:glycine hydroxymethyltransferase [Fonticula alba]|uniref:Glycine hydroxymethyltransferase n=1 Tax=Fonticula alba TaxID=691883 RepID=A0A058Z3N0_FONAL|nr:glycine hydroxymethyltransferase [Fonticula alba]KCV68894.1 glycine hydroxymethyltransferase [Fonticula alba]|eukprot:XP_009496465.1 glycine hydroxymethyltransferase [Fonticula alba]
MLTWRHANKNTRTPADPGSPPAAAQAASPEFKEYAKLVVDNSRSFAQDMMSFGYDIVSGGTDNHLFLLDLSNKGVDGARAERVLELVNIASNKNTVPKDRSALVPSGLRVGTPAMTTRGLSPEDFKQIAQFLHRGITIAAEVQASLPAGSKFRDFRAHLGPNGEGHPGVAPLREEVIAFARRFPAVGFNTETMKYRPE